MKRIILLLLLVALVAPFAASQTSVKNTYIGVVMYQFDARYWVPAYYEDPLNADLQVLPVDPSLTTSRQIPATEPDHYLVDIREAATAADQISAIESLLAAGVSGLVIMPVAETNLVKNAVAAAASKVPVVLTGRGIPGLNLPFFGFDPGELGKQLGNGKPTLPFVIIGNLSDGYQLPFIEALNTFESFKGFYEAATEDGRAEAAQAIADVPGLAAILVSNAKYTPGAAEAIKAVTAGTDRLIKLGSMGAPVGWKDLFSQKLLHAVWSFDSYQVTQQAAVAVKVMLHDGVEPTDFYPDILNYSSATGYNHQSWPYSKDIPNRLSGFWPR